VVFLTNEVVVCRFVTTLGVVLTDSVEFVKGEVVVVKFGVVLGVVMTGPVEFAIA